MLLKISCFWFLMKSSKSLLKKLSSLTPNRKASPNLSGMYSCISFRFISPYLVVFLNIVPVGHFELIDLAV